MTILFLILGSVFAGIAFVCAGRYYGMYSLSARLPMIICIAAGAVNFALFGVLQ